MNGNLEKAPLNTLPLGLLDFLGIKSFGRYPDSLGTSIQPTIDVWQNLVQANDLIYSTALTTLAADTSASDIDIPGPWAPIDIAAGGVTEVPSGELWYLTAWDVVWAMGTSAQFIDAVPVYRTPAAGSIEPPCELMGFTTKSAAAPATWSGARSLKQPVWLRSGTRLLVRVHAAGVAANSITWGTRIRAIRVKG